MMIYNRLLSCTYLYDISDVDPVSSGEGEGSSTGANLMCIYEPQTAEPRGKPHVIAVVVRVSDLLESYGCQFSVY